MMVDSLELVGIRYQETDVFVIPLGGRNVLERVIKIGVR